MRSVHLERQCGGPTTSVCTDSSEARSLQSKASTYNVLTDVALGVGGAALVGGTIWWFYAKGLGSRTPRYLALQVTPIQGGAMLGLQGAF